MAEKRVNPTKQPTASDCQPEQLSAEQALEKILAAISPIQQSENIAITQALGRVLAAPVNAPIQVPGHDNSAMDGYALSSTDRQLACDDGLRMIGRSLAGHPYLSSVQSGECVRIMTGAVMPAGADSVVMQEQVTLQGDQVLFPPDFGAGDNVRSAGEDLQAGQAIFTKGAQLRTADIGLLACLGLTTVEVVRKVRVAFFSTGDELVSGGTALQPGQIYDSNRQTLAALLQLPTIEPQDLGLIPDQPEKLRTTFAQARDQADVIITSGGVSVGEADFVKEVFSEQGAIDFWRIAIKPGRPLAFGKVGKAWFFGLPGNPVSSYVTFDLFARPALDKIAGSQPAAPLRLLAQLDHAIKKRPGRKEYQRGVFSQAADGSLTVHTTGNQSSGVLSSVSQANCYIALAADSQGHDPGDWVTIEPFRATLSRQSRLPNALAVDPGRPHQ